MPFAPLTGINGAVKIASTAYAFKTWKVSFKAGLPKVNNFTSVYQQLVSGLLSATVTLAGPYDTGNMAFTTGSAVTFILGWSASVTLTVPVLIESLEGDQDAEDAGRVQLVGQSTGSFTAAIV